MITKECCKGIIAFLPTVFTSDFEIDEQKNMENIRKLIDAGADTIQCTGGAGEFYALGYKQHETMMRILVEEAKGKAHTMAGCGASSTEDAILKTKIAQDYGIDAAILVLPSYFSVTVNEAINFFDDIATACPNIGLVHFNTARSSVVFSGKDYKELSKVSNLIGSKQPSLSLFDWFDIKDNAPDMEHFITDDLLVPAMMVGCEGVDSLAIATRPSLLKKTYDLCKEKKWDEAQKLQILLWKLSIATNRLAELEAKYSDCTFDKAVIEAAGFLHSSDPKAPYLPMDRSDVDLLKKNFEAFDEAYKI